MTRNTVNPVNTSGFRPPGVNSNVFAPGLPASNLGSTVEQPLADDFHVDAVQRSNVPSSESRPVRLLRDALNELDAVQRSYAGVPSKRDVQAIEERLLKAREFVVQAVGTTELEASPFASSLREVHDVILKPDHRTEKNVPFDPQKLGTLVADIRNLLHDWSDGSSVDACRSRVESALREVQSVRRSCDRMVHGRDENRHRLPRAEKALLPTRLALSAAYSAGVLTALVRGPLAGDADLAAHLPALLQGIDRLEEACGRIMRGQGLIASDLRKLGIVEDDVGALLKCFDERARKALEAERMQKAAALADRGIYRPMTDDEFQHFVRATDQLRASAICAAAEKHFLKKCSLTRPQFLGWISTLSHGRLPATVESVARTFAHRLAENEGKPVFSESEFNDLVRLAPAEPEASLNFVARAALRKAESSLTQTFLIAVGTGTLSREQVKRLAAHQGLENRFRKQLSQRFGVNP